MLWFGTACGGVSCYDEQTFTTLTTDDGLMDNFVQASHRDQDGVLWIGTGSGVSRYDGKKVVNFTPKDGLVSGPVSVIHHDSDGTLWFGTGGYAYGGGVSRYNPSTEHADGKRFVNFTTEDGLVHNRIMTIHHDLDGVVWFGTEGGVSRYDGKGFVTFTNEDGLAHNWVNAIHRAPDGMLWFGTRDGVSQYDGEKFLTLTTETGLVDNLVNAVHRYPDSGLWFGTKGGVSRYNGKTFVNFTQQDGLAGNTVTVIHHDRDDILWFGTYGGGVSGYDGVAWTSLNARYGLANNIVFSIDSDSDGTLWFSTYKGLTRYRRNRTVPGIQITSLRKGRDYTKGTHRGLSQRKVPPITIGDRATIEYNAIDFVTLPERRQYRVRIKEIDDDWRHPTKSTFFDHTFKKPGDYTFEVQAIDRDLNYSEPASLKLEVVSPFYLRVSFLIPTASISTILLATLVILATALFKRRREVRAYERLAAQELQDARDMQMSLLPETAPPIEGFDIAGSSVPANTVGGDFFDYLSLADGKIGIALADISGKGLKGAMNAVLTNGMLDEVVKLEDSCGQILSALNAGLYPRMEKMIFTAFGFAILEENAQTLWWSNAAQPYPMVKQGEQVFEFKSDGELPLGMMPNVAYSDRDFELQAGDIFILYTDGIIEAENKAEGIYGTERLEQVVKRVESTVNAEGIIDTILQDVSDFVGTAEQYDDMTIVVVKKL